MSEEWISAETEAKEDDFRGILKMHASICKGIMRRFGGPPYLYVDLFAGPGQLQFNGHEFPGSPLIAREVLGSVPHRRVHFERDPAVAGCLAGALDGDGEVHAESCQDGFSRWLNEYTHRSGQYGLIYSDPIRDEIPHELLNHAARRLPRVDILSYVAATQYKRRRGVDPDRIGLGYPKFADWWHGEGFEGFRLQGTLYDWAARQLKADYPDMGRTAISRALGSGPATAFNETTGEGISWAAWSWNPVTGCLHGCDYCYARAIAHRFTDGFPVGFTPLFHHERLDAPANTTIPAVHRNDPAYRRVFVCSMADLYGRWVPDEWIAQVHASMLATPWWEYLLLTKFPARYVGLDLPPSAWVGTSVDEQKRVRIAEDAFRKIEGVKVKWLSLEPLREPLEFDDLSMFDWVVIGAQTETRQPDGTVDAFMPPWEWVCRITAQAKAAGCAVHWKPNLLNGKPGVALNEYPGGV